MKPGLASGSHCTTRDIHQVMVDFGDAIWPLFHHYCQMDLELMVDQVGEAGGGVEYVGKPVRQLSQVLLL